jgi:hypothetical protein
MVAVRHVHPGQHAVAPVTSVSNTRQSPSEVHAVSGATIV